jgi:hypothetical protein
VWKCQKKEKKKEKRKRDFPFLSIFFLKKKGKKKKKNHIPKEMWIPISHELIQVKFNKQCNP